MGSEIWRGWIWFAIYVGNPFLGDVDRMMAHYKSIFVKETLLRYRNEKHLRKQRLIQLTARINEVFSGLLGLRIRYMYIKNLSVHYLEHDATTQSKRHLAQNLQPSKEPRVSKNPLPISYPNVTRLGQYFLVAPCQMTPHDFQRKPFIA